MNTSGFSTVLTAQIKHFNGGLFKDANALPLDTVQLSLLIEAAGRDRREVEPSIFGTLLERALSPKERHKLGAPYTPRAYVERHVAPALIEPLRADWALVQLAALQLNREGRLDEARAAMRAFHRQLCDILVRDPACGSGNFLYVALELMKRLEGARTIRHAAHHPARHGRGHPRPNRPPLSTPATKRRTTAAGNVDHAWPCPGRRRRPFCRLTLCEG
ncbi:MAG: hypothetical protein H7245_25765 [Candidatus Saccharibacteria bacterium]|nr:hypothetical protein [Pseudorhodobacter sp.]